MAQDAPPPISIGAGMQSSYVHTSEEDADSRDNFPLNSVRLYVNVCERHMAPRGLTPSTPEERVFAATLAFNAGDYDDALEHLLTASRESPDHDHVLYMLATVLTLRDQPDEAVPHLLRAIDLNHENRSMARHDPDLEPLRRYDTVRAALESVSPVKVDRRKPQRRSR